MSQPTLTWFFKADFKDGSTYYQSVDDKPIIAESGSAFTDIVPRLSEIVKFSLSQDTHTVSVDLLDGHFEIDGVSFKAHPQNQQIEDLRLIYFRETKYRQNQQTGETEHFISGYYIGWQCTIDGNNIQQTICVL